MGRLKTKLIQDSAIIEQKIQDGAITSGKIAASAVITGKFDDSAVTTDKFSTGAVGETKIYDLAVTTDKLGNGAVTRDKLGADCVSSAKIANDAVNVEHYAPGSIESVAFQADAVESTNIGDDQVNTQHYAPGSIGYSQLAQPCAIAGKFAAGGVDTDDLAAGAITTDKMSTGCVDSAAIGDGQVAAAKLADDAIDSDQIAASAIDDTHLSSDAKETVLETKYSAFLVEADSISAGTGSSIDIDEKMNSSLTFRKYLPSGTSTPGAIVDSPNNRGLVRDHSTRDAIQDGSGREVFGRVTKALGSTLTGTLTFTNGLTSVAGVGTQFLSELAVGDLIRVDTAGETGSWFGRVASITNDTALTLGPGAWQGPTSSGVNFTKIDFTFSFYVWNGSSEIAHSMSSETIDIMMPESQDLYNAALPSTINATGYSEPLPVAHDHDDRYFTETELGATTGAALIGYDNSGSGMAADDVQDAIDELAGRVGGAGGTPRQETKTITVQNTIPDLTNTPVSNASVRMYVEGAIQENGVDYSLNVKQVTWNAGAAGYNIDPGDLVIFSYRSSD